MVGGPRSGKTQQLVELAVGWLAAGGDPTRLVLVVRSREGATALRQRIEGRLPPAHPALEVRTHQQLARTVLATVGGGADPPRPLSQTGEWLAMREALRQAAPLPRLADLVDQPSCISDALAVVSACKRALVGPGLLAERLRGAPDSLAELAVVMANYERVLGEIGSRDAQDSYSQALELLFGDPGAMSGWADLFLVDEAEDLSPAQWFLIRELGLRLSPPGRLAMAGHWSESIPGYRGVSSESSSRPFDEYFPSELSPEDWVLAPVLPKWTEELTAALNLDAGADEELPDPMNLEPLAEAAFRLGMSTRVWAATDETDEALAVAREIARARLQGEIEFDQVAVLVRSANRQLIPLQAALSSLGIPFRRLSVGEGSRLPMVAVALNWLRVICRPSDDLTLLSALAVGPRAVSPGAIRLLRRTAGRRDWAVTATFFCWAGKEESEPTLGAESEEGIRLDHELRAAARFWRNLIPHDLSEDQSQLDWPQWRSVLGRVELSSGLAEAALSNLDLAGGLAQLEATAQAVADVQLSLGREALTPSSWLELLQLALRHGSGETETVARGERSQVAVLTIRQAKGRSWNRVFLCGCMAGSFPAPAESGGLLDPEEVQDLVRRVPELEDVVSAGDRQLDAEARLFLVGLTRATAEVTCSWARRYQGRVTERSPFLDALISAGTGEVGAPRAELVHPDDLATELALSVSSQPLAQFGGELSEAASELRQAVAPWDPVSEGAAMLGSPLSLSATSIAAWLACPRQYLAQMLVSEGQPNVNLTLGSQVHRLLELMYRQRDSWEGTSSVFSEIAGRLVREQLMPAVRADLDDPLQIVYVQLWLERMVARWGRQIVAAGTAQVGRPIAEEVSFDLPEEGWQLRGKVDALWRHPDGEIELLDYKTSGNPTSERELRSEVFGDPPEGPQQWQLPIYQIAARTGAFSEHLGDRLPTRVRNWYVGRDPGPRDPNPIVATGFRIVAGDDPGGPGTLSEGELDRIEAELDGLAQVIREGHFPAQPRHSLRTCRDGRNGCPMALWCDGENSVGGQFPAPGPEL